VGTGQGRPAPPLPLHSLSLAVNHFEQLGDLMEQNHREQRDIKPVKSSGKLFGWGSGDTPNPSRVENLNRPRRYPCSIRWALYSGNAAGPHAARPEALYHLVSSGYFRPGRLVSFYSISW
jgi:hypothetical protein